MSKHGRYPGSNRQFRHRSSPSSMASHEGSRCSAVRVARRNQQRSVKPEENVKEKESWFRTRSLLTTSIDNRGRVVCPWDLRIPLANFLMDPPISGRVARPRVLVECVVGMVTEASIDRVCVSSPKASKSQVSRRVKERKHIGVSQHPLNA